MSAHAQPAMAHLLPAAAHARSAAMPPSMRGLPDDRSFARIFSWAFGKNAFQRRSRERSMKRRSALKLIAASAVLPSLDACARVFRSVSPASAPASRYHIVPVRVAPERVIREVVGLRPYRRSGFRVEAET